jgi:hypothetical protein
MPTLKIPAYPHCMLIPIDIIADMMHIFKIERLIDQDCPNPTNKNNKAIINMARISLLFVLFTKFSL